MFTPLVSKRRISLNSSCSTYLDHCFHSKLGVCGYALTYEFSRTLGSGTGRLRGISRVDYVQEHRGYGYAQFHPYPEKLWIYVGVFNRQRLICSSWRYQVPFTFVALLTIIMTVRLNGLGIY